MNILANIAIWWMVVDAKAMADNGTCEACTIRSSRSTRPSHRHIVLDSVESARLRDACFDFDMPAPSYDSGDARSFVSAARRYISDNAPHRLKVLLESWQSNPGAFSVLLVDNLPTEANLPATPIDGQRSPHKLTNCSELLATGIAALLGQPIAFATEKPWLVNDIIPVLGMEAALTNAGSTDNLPWHFEHSSTGMPLDILAVSELVLTCLRGDPFGQGHTLVADVRDALELVGAEEERILRESQFFFRLPPSMREISEKAASARFGPRPLLRGQEDTLHAIGGLYPGGVEALTPAARRALDALRSALDQVGQAVESVPGRAVILNNRNTCHARSHFQPRYDGSDRWLQRVLVTRDLKAWQPWLQHSTHIVDSGALARIVEASDAFVPWRPIDAIDAWWRSPEA